ncbi:hypothetical protein DS831_06020 [Bombilactobacillus bombi]|uniref:Phage gp6-like head-tail connector protein n=1 Tax=Bombilactobacillus bombi TaxID=1303590 RepID=A0A417ZEM6_9LACO|nr:hypothetical protein [Bombilactobacillus bombi]RHW49717.1 hypothetical protein DS831_06020 [Bombilactobacillus bombi]
MNKHPRFSDLSQKINKLFPKFDKDKQMIIDWALEKTINDVSNYTHLKVSELSEAMDDIIVAICLQLIETHQWLDANQESNVASLSEGDASITFKTPAETYNQIQSVNSITDDFKSQLNSFRRLLW